MNPVLAAWNAADAAEASKAILACCGAKRWAAAMAAARPITSIDELRITADRTWSQMTEPDWLEAFACHPRIGERKAAHTTPKSTSWSSQEQSSTATAASAILEEIAAGNQHYEELFGFTYIVCATGKSAKEMLAILKRRLNSDRATELREAAEQQRQITQIRLQKWLAE